MLEKHPNRKKDKYNPYTLTITEGIITSLLKMGVESNRILRLPPMKQGTLSASLPAHECCPLHDDGVQKKD